MGDTDEDWIQYETALQNKINDIEIEFQPCKTLNVTVLRGRKISVGFFHDIFDVPDCQVYLCCEKAIGKKKFRTHVAKNSRNPEWNESFTFLLPDEEEDVKIELKVYEEDRFKFDPNLGTFLYEIKELEMDKTNAITMDMKKRGQIDIEMTKTLRTSPDYRLSLGLSKNEREFRLKRKPKTMKALQKLLGDEEGPKNFCESPTIALAITGGGYRAVATSSGAMEALAESELIDTLTYIAGLSGSSWYISTSYLHQTLGSYESLIKHHDWLRERMEESLAWCLFDISFYKRYWAYRDFKAEHQQETTFVDFYGLSLGEKFLGRDHVQETLTSLRAYVETADAPFPIISCAHVHEYLPMSAYWDEVEITPFEISLPGYGINIPAKEFNSQWGNGILQQKLPEPPLHFMMGASGSAFAILFSKASNKNENDQVLNDFIDKLEESHHQQKENPEESDEEKEHLDDKVMPTSIRVKAPVNFSSDDDKWIEKLQAKAETQSEENPEEAESLGRSFILGRTAKVNNCATHYHKLEKFRFNTQPVDMAHAVTERFKRMISTKQLNISLCDSALGCNLPAVHVMRPQRTVDVLIVVDASNYYNESTLVMELFVTVQDQLYDHGIRFPTIAIKEKIAEDPFREFYLFEHPDDPTYPIVLWFTLANAKFKELKNPHRRPGFPTPDAAESGEVKFNDFCIFPESSDFGTMRLSFSALNYDRLRELTRFNIIDNIKIVKEMIAKKVQQLRDSKRTLEDLHLFTDSSNINPHH